LVELTGIEPAAPRCARALGSASGGWRTAPPEPPEIGRRFDPDQFRPANRWWLEGIVWILVELTGIEPATS
jgi:hypothetical protein